MDNFGNPGFILLIASYVMSFFVTSTLRKLNSVEEDSERPSDWTPRKWRMASIAAFVGWLITLFLLTRIGLIDGIGFVVFAGPAIYLIVAYRVIRMSRIRMNELRQDDG